MTFVLEPLNLSKDIKTDKNIRCGYEYTLVKTECHNKIVLLILLLTKYVLI